MPIDLASANDRTERDVESPDTSTASKLFDEVRDLIFGSAREITRGAAGEAINTREESGAEDTPRDKGGPSDKPATTEPGPAAPVGRGDTRPTAGGSMTGPVSGVGRRHGSPSTFADDVADNVKEHPIATGIETLLFPPLVILDTEIRKAVDKPASRTGR